MCSGSACESVQHDCLIWSMTAQQQPVRHACLPKLVVNIAAAPSADVRGAPGGPTDSETLQLNKIS